MKNTSEQNTKRNLCDTCKSYHDYPYCTDKMKFGDGVGGDNVCECEEYIEMNELEKKVCELENECDKDKQIKILQEIEELLLKCVIRFDDIKIRPLWIEAYYYDEQTFPDCNTHMSQKQSDRFGQLMFHEKGRGGIDLCLSNSKDYYLSFLLKAALVNEEFKKQTAMYEICSKSNKSENDIENLKNILFKGEENYAIRYAKRINLERPCYKDEPLAAFSLDDIRKYDFVFARSSLSEVASSYMDKFIKKNSGKSKSEYQEECRKKFGWLPDLASKKINEQVKG